MALLQKIRVTQPRITLEVNGFGMPVTCDWLRIWEGQSAYIRDLRLKPGDMVRTQFGSMLHIWSDQQEAVRRGALDQPPFIIRVFPVVELGWLTDPGRASILVLKWSETEGFYTH